MLLYLQTCLTLRHVSISVLLVRCGGVSKESVIQLLLVCVLVSGKSLNQQYLSCADWEFLTVIVDHNDFLLNYGMKIFHVNTEMHFR